MNQIAPKSVLIVDDSLDMHELLTLLLESKGYSVECRSNGQEALELLNSDYPLPQVILLDLRMPVMDGLDFLELQKQSARIRDIPVIMMTAEDDLAEVNQRFKPHGIISKPLSMNSVLNAIDKSPILH